ncbi:MAG: O-antigen ligase family protein, partial [Gaiellales bacterium]
VWSRAGKIDPSLFEDGFRRARLREPLGLWNALGLMFAYGVPLSLWLARRRHSSLVRALATGFLFLLVPALILTLSRAGIIAALAVAAAWLVLSSGRLETLAAVLLSVPAGAVVAAWALRQPGIADERQELAVRAADGRALGVVLAAGFAAVVLVAFALYAAERRRPLSEERRRRIVSAAAWLATLLAIVAIVVAVVRVGDPADWVEARFDEFTSPELLTNEAGRLTSTSSNARWRWWQEAADAWTDNPLVGTGAGSFPVVHRLYRDDSLTVRQPHNIVLQFLAETGIVGLLLLVASAVAGLVAAWRMVRAYEVPERPAGLALLLVLAIYGLHSVVEVDWDFLALSAPVFFGAGVLLAYGRSRWLEDARAAGILPAAVLGLCIVSLILPPLSSQAVSRSAERLAEDPAAALDAARAAAALNPVALDPLLARAEAEITLGRPDRARAAYEQATRTQPRNARGWFAMASFEADLGNLSAARAAYVQAKARDPRSCTVLALGVELGLEPQGCTGPRS